MLDNIYERFSPPMYPIGKAALLTELRHHDF